MSERKRNPSTNVKKYAKPRPLLTGTRTVSRRSAAYLVKGLVCDIRTARASLLRCAGLFAFCGKQSTPTPTPTPSTVAEVKAGSITVSGKVNEAGSIIADLSAEKIAEAVAAADKGKVVIDVRPAAGERAADSTIIKVPLKNLIAGAEVQELSIVSGSVTVHLPVKPEQGVIAANAGMAELRISHVKAESLPKAREGHVFDIELIVDGKEVTGFNGRSVQVEMSYAAQDSEKAHQLVIYRLNDDGSVRVMKDFKYENGVFRFYPEEAGIYAVGYADVSFKDAGQAPWAQDIIEALASREIIAGTGNDEFSPQREVTRAEFLQLLVSALNLQANGAAASFTDVQESDWYAQVISVAAELGIVKVKADGSFAPNEAITREDMAVLTVRALALLDRQQAEAAQSGAFSDGAQVASYAQEAVETLTSQGLIKGFTDGSFKPKETASRAQAAAIIYRLLDLS